MSKDGFSHCCELGNQQEDPRAMAPFSLTIIYIMSEIAHGQHNQWEEQPEEIMALVLEPSRT